MANGTAQDAFPVELDLLQPSAFTLAQVTFNALSVGFSSLDFSDVVLSDGLAAPLDPVVEGASVEVAGASQVPAPHTLALFAAGLLGMRFSRLARRGGAGSAAKALA